MSDPRQYPDRPILAASTAVFRDGRILLGARRRVPYQDVFSFPGGVVETGETLEQAALRELREETGIEARIVGFSGHGELIDRDEAGRVRRHFVIACFAAQWISGEGEPGEEIGTIVWADPGTLNGLRVTPGLPGLLQRARALAGL